MQRRLESVSRAIDAFVRAMCQVLDERLVGIAARSGDVLRERIKTIRTQPIDAQEVWAAREVDLVRENLASLPSMLLDELRSQFGELAVTEHQELLESRISTATDFIVEQAAAIIDRDVLQLTTAYRLGYNTLTWAAEHPTWQSRLGMIAGIAGWYGGGLLALACAVSSAFSGKPVFADPHELPALFLFGCVSVVSLVWGIEYALVERATQCEPRDSLHGGQFTFFFIGMAASSVVGCALLITAFIASIGLADALSPSESPTWKAVLPWLGGIVAGVGGLLFVLWPFTALYRWFGSRRALERLRDDALLKLARDVNDQAPS